MGTVVAMNTKGKRRRTWTAFTVPHFREYCSRLVFDDGEHRPPESWQLDFARDVFRRQPDGSPEFAEAWLIVPEGNGKALDVATRLPTLTGWTTMGDARVGDELLGSDGLPTRVTYASPVLLGRRCYEVTFSDGASIVADADHLWTVEAMSDLYRERTLTTEQLLDEGVETARGQRKWRVRTAAREAPAADLPVDPYVLGAWLGDGCRGSGRLVSMDEPVWDRVRAAGYELGRDSGGAGRAQVRVALGLVRDLRRAGVLGRKHVPEAYLLASRAQRLALLQGLMDTDGHVSAAGQATFSTISDDLADGVRRLAWSLGRPCHRRVKRAVVNGEPYSSHELVIACDQRHAVAALPRKAQRLKARGLTADHRRIVSIERVPSRPVRCVQVSAADSLYLAGDALVPTHNTTFIAELALYGADFSARPWIPVGASARDQARILYNQAKGFVKDTPGMEHRFQCFDGYREIRSRRNGGRGIVICPWDPDTNDGVIPYPYSILDELHRHPTLALYRLWHGKRRKRGSQTLAISTAGEPHSEFERTRERLRNKASKRTFKGAQLRAVGGHVLLHEYMVRNADGWQDMRQVAAANPLSTVTAKTLAEDFGSATLDIGDWKRLKCNVPSRSSKVAVSERDWELAQVGKDDPQEIPKGEAVSVGADFAWTLDTTAIVPLWIPEPGFRLLGPAKILIPPRDGTMLDAQEVKDAFRELHARNPIKVVVMDKTKAQDTAQWLAEEIGCDVHDRAQGNENHAEDYEVTTRGLRERWLRHTGDAGLREHVMHAIARKIGKDRYRFDRPSPSRSEAQQDERVIDALTAAGMVVAVTDAALGKPRPKPMIAVSKR